MYVVQVIDKKSDEVVDSYDAAQTENAAEDIERNIQKTINCSKFYTRIVEEKIY